MLETMLGPQLVLRPNCLLTRRPLKFITGPRSLFFYKKPWGDIPEILYEHGYKVELISLPFRSSELRKEVLQLQKRRLDHSHVFIEMTTFLELGATNFPHSDSTLTVVSNSPVHQWPEIHYFEPRYSTTSLAYTLHQKWCALSHILTPDLNETLTNAPRETWDRLIDHCIELAELDFIERS